MAERAARCALPSVIGDGHPPSCGRRRRCLFLQLPHDSSSCSTPPTNPTRAEARGQRPPPPDARLSPTPLPSRAPRGLDFAIPPCCSVLRAPPRPPPVPLAHETVLHWPRRNRAGIKSTGGSRNTPLQRWERRRVECTQESGPPRHHRERGERSCAAVRAAVSAFLFLRIPWLAWYLVRKAQTLVSPRPPQPPASCPLQFVRAALPAEGARDPGGAARGAREE